LTSIPFLFQGRNIFESHTKLLLLLRYLFSARCSSNQVFPGIGLLEFSTLRVSLGFVLIVFEGEETEGEGSLS